jgi:hypothetical protein
MPSSRWSVPSVRSRLVAAKPSSSLRKSVNPASAVSWWTTTSGSARVRASITASRSSASRTTGVAPAARSASALSGVRVVPTTVWPLATSRGTSRRPRAPVAPATKIFMASSLVLVS